MLTNATHEIFVQKWIESDNKSEAYRLAYPVKTKKWKDVTVHKRASELSLSRDVLGRYNELKKESQDSHGITVDSLIKELEEIKLLAMGADTPQSSAAVTAVMSKAKLVGLDINRSVTVELSHEEWLGQLK